ncbi:unnamed protein product [Leptidea sinapis]|uniref:Uncharacterized protein n=1 Tax=Leptidea sinapis TaxID=189913 RepID=A0A5E4Q5T0_9NEOP|nr:unnamed protein product [Leptidea sinapis]
MADEIKVSKEIQVEEKFEQKRTKESSAVLQTETHRAGKLIPEFVPRSMIKVPSNCPPGTQRDADGFCREVW